MSSLITITPLTETTQGFQITDSSDMIAALQYLSPGGGITGSGYQGSIQSSVSGTTVTWTLLFASPGTNAAAQLASVGDWVILVNNTLASVCLEADFAGLYST